MGVILTAFLWLMLKIRKREAIRQKFFLVPVLLFASSGFFSLLINLNFLSVGQFFTSVTYLIRWLTYAFLFFVVSDFDKNFKTKILKILIVLGSLVVGLGYLQYLLYPNLRNLFYLGWDEHMFRMFSTFLDPNFAGAFFVLFFLFLISLAFKKKNIFIGLLTALTLGSIFLTFSRSALIMLFLSSSLLFVLMNRKIWIAILLGIMLSVLVVSSRYFNIENINLFRIVSSEARLETAKNAILIIKKNPIFGVGFNAYRYAQFRYGFRSQNTKTVSHADAGTDNSFLFAIATTGFVGFGFFIFLWFRIFKSAKNNSLIISSLAGVFISSLFINSLFYPSIMMWIWIIVAVQGE